MASTRRSMARSDTDSVRPTSLAINNTQRFSFIRSRFSYFPQPRPAPSNLVQGKHTILSRDMFLDYQKEGLWKINPGCGQPVAGPCQGSSRRSRRMGRKLCAGNGLLLDLGV